MKNTEIKPLANHREFDKASLYITCEEKNGAIYWYGYDDSKLKTVTTKTKRGCGRISKTSGNPWARISKKVAAEILAGYGITLEQFIAYTNEEPELMRELEAQIAEEERKELCDFYMSAPLTSNDAFKTAVEAEIELAISNANDADAEIETGELNDIDEEIATEPAVEDYNVSIEAQDTATDAEIALTKTNQKKAIKHWELEIEMYGNKRPMFLVNGIQFSRKEVDQLIRNIYEDPVKRANTIIEIPEVVAVLDFVKVFNDAPYLLRELNVVLTGMKACGGEALISQYASCYGVTPQAMEAATEAEIEFAGKDDVIDLPRGEYTVGSGAEAFALLSPYFPKGLEFDGLDYGYRGETNFCFYNELSHMSVVVMSDEDDRYIEAIEIINHEEKSACFKLRYPLIIRIAPKKNVSEPKVEMAVVVKNSVAASANVEDYAISTAAQDVAVKAEIKLAKANQKKLAADKNVKWLENAKCNEAGNYYVVPELTYKNYEANSNWKPCFYIVTVDLKLRRIGLNFAIELARQGRAIEVGKEVVPALGK